MLSSRSSFDPPHPEELGRRPSVSKDEAATVLAAHPSRRALRALLRGCESIDFGSFRPESNQGLRASENSEARIDSQALRMRMEQVRWQFLSYGRLQR